MDDESESFDPQMAEEQALFEDAGGLTFFDELAIARHEAYMAMIRAGFSSKQALFLLAAEDACIIPPDDF